MFRSDGDRRSFSLTRDITVIGRREDCDLRIPLGEVSRKHCRLVRDGDSLRLEDLGSSNGTYHNGQRVQEAILSPGDSIQVGPLVFVLQMDGVPADEDLAPVEAQPLDEAGGPTAMPEEGPLTPTAQSEVGMQELPTIDEGFDNLGELEPIEGLEPAAGLEPVAELEPMDELEPVAELEPASEEDLGFEMLNEDALEAPGEDEISLDEHEEKSPRH